ncbi:MAG: hypothetical protein LLG00_15235, partial [Planctomycetaceae bacterium]|nr:hypothetical protein [Planctomycetaceae bacterium]
GMPVRSTADGRLYKPLFAILCVDLDGRLNLNAHGSLAQTAAAYAQQVQPMGLCWSGTLAGGVASVSLPRGQGFGPADVNLNYVLSPSAPTDTTLYQRLLTGANGYQGRYGATGVPGAAGVDTLSINKWFQYAGDSANNGANNYWWGFLTAVPPAYVRDSYGTPADPFGAGAVALDVAGRPLWMSHMGESTADNPYELNLGPSVARGLPNGTPNNPFSPAELERILRPFDKDAPGLPARLLALTETTSGVPATSVLYQQRHSVTTESWDLPVPGVPMTSAATPTAANTRVADLLKARLMATAASGGGALSEAQALARLPQLLPPDVLAGLRMDINRPFGNGRADDANNPGIVDAPATPASPKQLTLAGSTISVAASYDGLSTPGTLAANPLAARQLQARYLYIMMLTLADRASLRTAFQLQPPATDPTGAIGAARAVAQWAINAVCFRDCDNVMIPFDYDPSYAYDNDISHRVTGWNTGTKAYRVWGCKRPELLITETLAFHDRKTEDLDADGGKVGSGDAHNDFDQQHRPQGSLFVELYNPAGPLEPSADATDRNPPFLAGTDTSGARHYVGCVRLNQTTPQGHPVWRLAIVAGADMGKDLNDPDDSLRPTIERSVYFV